MMVKFSQLLNARKVMCLKTGDLLRAKKVLAIDAVDDAIADGVRLNSMRSESDFNTVTYAALVSLSRSKTGSTEALKRMKILSQKLDSHGLTTLCEQLEKASVHDIDAIMDRIIRYAQLVIGTCADVFWFRNALVNPYARKTFDDKQLQCAREMCTALGIGFDESVSADET